MSKIKILEEKIAGLKERTNKTIDTLIKEVNNVNVESIMGNIVKRVIGVGDLKEPYTEGNAPDNIKKLPDKKKRQWIHIWNSVFEQTKSEEKAFKAANAILKESEAELDNLLDRTTKKQIMQKLLDEIDGFINKINDGIKNKPGSPAIRSFLREVKNKMKNILGNIKESDIREGAEKVIKAIEKFEEETPIKESQIKESQITDKGQAKEADLDIGFVSLSESTYDAVTGDIDVILIEAGTNEAKRRHYPVKTIEEAAPLFTGLKMYINHPTKTEEKERPERNLSDWASTIKESRAIAGKAVAKVSVHDPWLRERLANKTFRENVGLSINAGGLISYGKVNGKEMQIVEKITLNRRNGPASVDWVTEAGARGRVASELFESRGRKVKKMELNDATLTEIFKERPDLVKQLKESIVKEITESKENVAKEAKLTEALKKIVDFEKEKATSGNKALVEGWLKEKKVDARLHERITESLAGKEFKNEAELKESFENVVKKEIEFLNKISGKGKINLGEGEEENNGSLLESLSNDLDNRAGIKEKKKEKEGE